MSKHVSSLFLSLLLVVALLVGCAGNGQNGDSEAKTKTITPPANIEKTTPQFTGADRATYTHPIRNELNKFVTMETNYGRMVAELYHDLAPAHADSFVARTADGFYDSTIFHRVIDGFMIQGGGYDLAGNHKPVSYSINAEFSDVLHYEGTLSAARTNDLNSASTQFFVCLGRFRSTAGLDKQYTVFGQLISGYDTLAKIGKVECKTSGREKSSPVEPVIFQKAYVSDAQGNPI